MSQFYDGIQIYKSSVKSFWPFMITILNLPPTYRNRLGIGMHLLSIFTGKAGSTTESFLLNDLIVQELILLERGITVNVKDTSYFIQCRMILTILDTIAVQDFLKIQTVGSYSGCGFCNAGTGVRRSILSKITYPGHRRILPMNHVLRSFGQSRACCPHNYYVPAANCEIEEIKYGDSIVVPTRFMNKNIDNICDQSSRKEIFALKQFQWFHDYIFPFNYFSDNLYYHHCDYRKTIQHNRKPNKDYVDSANEFFVKRISDPTIKHINGVKGIWPFSKLSYIDLPNNINWDPFHAIVNCSKYLIQCMKGERINAKVAEYCRFTKTHPYIHDYNDSVVNFAPWCLQQNTQLNIDAIINCLYVPFGYSEDFQVKHVFKRSGLLKGIESIQVFTVLINLIVYFGNLDFKNAYCFFYRMFGHDVNLLLGSGYYELSNDRSSHNIDHIYDLILELVSIHEGLFPESESLMVWHQLIDLPNFIKQFGPLRGWWAFPGERSLSSIKTNVPICGRRYCQIALDRYELYANARTNVAFNRNAKYSAAKFKKLKSTMDRQIFRSNLYDIKFNDFDTSIKGRLENTNGEFQFTSYEWNCLLKELLLHVKNLSTSLKEAMNNSCLYRIYYAYDYHKKHGVKLLHTCSFYDWVIILSKVRSFAVEQQLSDCDKYNSKLLEYIDSSIDGHFDCYESGRIKLHDLQICDEIIAMKIQGTKSAIIHGCKHNGQGYDFREIQPTKNGSPSNPKNHLKENWCRSKESLSSWGSFYNSRTARNVSLVNNDCFGLLKQLTYEDIFISSRDEHKNLTYYCQFNFFFGINLPSDKTLNNLDIASVSTRKSHFILNQYLTTISCNDPLSFVKDLVFIPLGYIGPTTYLILGIDELRKPFLLRNVQQNFDETISEYENYYSKLQVNKIHCLILLPLYQWRLNSFDELIKTKYIQG
jgi:hypothetical protein